MDLAQDAQVALASLGDLLGSNEGSFSDGSEQQAPQVGHTLYLLGRGIHCMFLSAIYGALRAHVFHILLFLLASSLTFNRFALGSKILPRNPCIPCSS